MFYLLELIVKKKENRATIIDNEIHSHASRKFYFAS